MTSSSLQITPKPIELTNQEGEKGRYYIEGNPWKKMQSGVKIYRCCWFCGQNRFTDQTWNKIADTLRIGNNAIRCNKETCMQALGKCPKKVLSLLVTFKEGGEYCDYLPQVKDEKSSFSLLRLIFARSKL